MYSILEHPKNKCLSQTHTFTGGLDLESSLYLPIIHWTFQNHNNPDESELATIVYEPISREESAESLKSNP